MKLYVQAIPVLEFVTDLLVVDLFEDAPQLNAATSAVDGALHGAISELVATGDLTGKAGETKLLYPRGALAAKRVLIVGLGQEAAFDANAIRKAAATAARQSQELKLASYGTVVYGVGVEGLHYGTAAQALAEGVILGSYQFSRYLTKEDATRTALCEVTLLAHHVEAVAALEAGAIAGQQIANGVCLARDLINTPGNDLPPVVLAACATQLAADSRLSCTVLDEAQMEALGMGSLLAVGKGTDQPSQFIVLEHNADRTDLKPYVVVGKGITFDSGGISLKPGQGMEQMKYDMSGAAATLGIMQAVAALDLPIRVVGLAPAVENMPSGKAYRPGDVLKAMTGKTIEVISTDAEGRLILADALAYAQCYEPQAVVDMATLTGACIVALGHVASAMMANDDALAAQLERAAAASGEKTWRLPLWDEYGPQIKSDVADIKNSGGREAGTIIGGIFLQHFVDYPWAHLDIAGMAWSDKTEGWLVKGGAGYGVRLITAWLRQQAAAQ